MQVVHTPACLAHRAEGEAFAGGFVPATEVPERAVVVLEHVRATGLGPVRDPERHPDDALLAVHDTGLVDHLPSTLRPEAHA